MHTLCHFQYRACVRALLSAALIVLTCAAALADIPLPQFGAANITDVLGNAQGGLARSSRVLDKIDLTATWLGDDHGRPGLSLFLDLQATSAADFTGAVVGDAQGISSIDAPAGARLANAWVARDFDGKGGFKAGIIDLNTEFDVQATAALFLNSAFGIGPDFSQAGENGPSIFPATGFGLVGWWLPGDHWQIKLGLFEGTPGRPFHPGRTALALAADEGALLAFELRYRPTPDFVLGAGAWRYTASFDAIDPAMGRLSSNAGYYLIADGLLWSPSDAAAEDESGLSGWARIGFADNRINAVQTAFSGGFVYTAPFGRQADQAGLAVTRVQFGAPARQADGLRAAETTLEATYSLGLGEHFTIQPDFQYVISPGGALDNAVVVGSRFTASW